MADETTGTVPSGTETKTDESASQKPDAQASPDQSSGASKTGREDWVPPYRLREVSDRAERTERAFAELQQRLEQQDVRVRQVFGVEQPDPKKEAIRKEFLSYFPEYAKLARFAERLGDRDPGELLDRLEQGQQQSQLAVAHQMYDVIDQQMAEAYGEKVPQFARDAAYAAFVTWLSQNPQHEARFNRHDASLATEFWKLYSSGVLETHRQHFTETEQRRRAAAMHVPRGGSGSADIVPGKKEKKVYKDLDEATDEAFSRLAEQR